jgi:hypothetical protein
VIVRNPINALFTNAWRSADVSERARCGRDIDGASSRGAVRSEIILIQF